MSFDLKLKVPHYELQQLGGPPEDPPTSSVGL